MPWLCWGNLRLATVPEREIHKYTPRTGFAEHSAGPRWRIDLQPWASPSHALEDEAIRFLNYIQTPHVSCGPSPGPGSGPEPAEGPPGAGPAWRVCLDERFSLVHRVRSKHCRVYSLGLGMVDKQLELALVGAGCEVHCFDPSIKQAHLQDSHIWHHRLSVDWRDPNPAIPAQNQRRSTKKLAAILNDFGHRKEESPEGEENHGE
ncbi:probable methyltransferase-like protein 24 [Conger conger]|uniref:probable methyltransferase-like protein 24 n=1 Tax=Conger conger TaxID=82655 RepID=UPI002A5A31FC|nr:probable methyltransferase-like protein 24 [Conger conger]